MEQENENMDQIYEGLRNSVAVGYTQDTLSRVPRSILRNVDVEFQKMFGGLSLTEAPAPPSSKLNPGRRLTRTMHAYFRRCTAESRGCAVYGTESGTVFFVTDLFPEEMDEASRLLVGWYLGEVDFFYQIWECGETLADGITTNLYRKNAPEYADDAQRFLQGEISIPDPKEKFIRTDIEDPYHSADTYKDLVAPRKRKRGIS
jgi:hypothetical protein